MPRRSTEVWKRIRARYERGGTPIVEIARDEGLSREAIYARARRKGWDRPRGDADCGDRERIEQAVRRLLAFSDRLSRSIVETGATSASEGQSCGETDSGVERERLDDIERQIKLLQSLVRTIQALARLSAGSANGRTGSTSGTDEGADDGSDNDLADMRRELARRLDRAVEGG